MPTLEEVITETSINPLVESLSSVAPFETNRIISTLSSSNQAFFQKLKPTLDTAKLLNHIVWGREAEARTMLIANPTLLLKRAGVTSEVGREYKNVTPYELALYCGDTQMCEMLHAFFDKLNDGESVRLKQYRHVFPDGVKAVIDAQEAYNFDALINAIHIASAGDVEAQIWQKDTKTPLGQIINAFRNEFAALSRGEPHANLKHLHEAFRVYAQDPRIAQWEQQENWSKMGIFWRQVIGYVQLYLPECDKQVFHQGLYDVVENNVRLSREIDFKYGQGDSLHLLSDSSGCGYDFAQGDGLARDPFLRSRGPWPSAHGARLAWKSYVEKKQQTYRTYVAESRPPKIAQ